MRLTPRDIQEKEFSTSFRGYKEEEVDAFLDEVTEAYEAVFKENLDLREEVEKLREECKKYEAIGERMQGALVAAQETADDVRKNAAKEAENLVREAELKAQKLIQESKDKHVDLQRRLASLKQVEEEFRFKLKSVLQSYLKFMEELPFGERKEVKEHLAYQPDIKAEPLTRPTKAKERLKEEVKEEPKEEPKEELKEEPKAQAEEAAKVEAKEEIPIPFDLGGEEKPAVRKIAPKEEKKAVKAAKKPQAEKKEEEPTTQPGIKEEKKAEEAPKAKEAKEEKEKIEEIEIIEDETFWKDP